MKNMRSIALIFALLVTGCVSTSQPIPPGSLTQFRDTLVGLNTKSMQALTFEYEWNYRNFKDRIKADNQSDPTPLTLRFCSGNYDWRWDDCDSNPSEMPVFNVIAQSRVELKNINQAMIDYAHFMILLNSANEGSKANLDAAAKKVGDATKSISTRFGLSLDEAKFGAFSTIGVAVVQQLLSKKQRTGMAAVMTDFQPGVNSFADLGSRAMAISATGIKKEYQDETGILARAIATETDGAKRLQKIEKLLELNEQASSQLDSLRILNAAYDALPNAHAELISALQSGQYASMQELVGYIEMIGEIHQTFQNADPN